jgi:hypothetical protein
MTADSIEQQALVEARAVIDKSRGVDDATKTAADDLVSVALHTRDFDGAMALLTRSMANERNQKLKTLVSAVVTRLDTAWLLARSQA